MSSLIEVKHLKKYYNKGEIKALDRPAPASRRCCGL